MAPLHDESCRHRSRRRHSIRPVRHRLIRIILHAIDRAPILLDITGTAFTKLATKFVHQARASMCTIVLGVEDVLVFISISGFKDVVDVLYNPFIIS